MSPSRYDDRPRTCSAIVSTKLSFVTHVRKSRDIRRRDDVFYNAAVGAECRPARACDRGDAGDEGDERRQRDRERARCRSRRPQFAPHRAHPSVRPTARLVVGHWRADTRRGGLEIGKWVASCRQEESKKGRMGLVAHRTDLDRGIGCRRRRAPLSWAAGATRLRVPPRRARPARAARRARRGALRETGSPASGRKPSPPAASSAPQRVRHRRCRGADERLRMLRAQRCRPRAGSMSPQPTTQRGPRPTRWQPAIQPRRERRR